MFTFDADRILARRRLRAGLLAGVGLLALGSMGGFAQAQETPSVASRQVVEQPGPDGLTSDGLYLEADSITRDPETAHIVAFGSVEARYQGRLLRADQVDYYESSGLLSARGNAELINPDGTVQYAETIDLDDELRAGVATGFAARLENNIKIAAATAVRRSETVNELNNAVFTPCDICNSEGEASEPTWSIQASTIVQDQDRAVVFYRNAVIRVAGIPIFYAPVFWHPDPTAERQSGLLVPTVSSSDGRGFSYEQPYLWVISPSEDLIISPQINASVNPFLNLNWRRRFYSGTADIRAGYTHEQLFGNIGAGPGLPLENMRYGQAESRGYMLGQGAFAINDEWRWGFAIERVSDPTLFDRYSIEDVFEDRGLFHTDHRRLLSQLYVERQTPNSYFSAAILSFQSLRLLGFDNMGGTLDNNDVRGLVFENSDTLPIVGPMIEARWEPAEPVFGGRLRLQASGVALFRQDYVGSPVLSALYLPPVVTPGLPGVDSARATFEMDWRRALTTSFGLRLEPFITARADFYTVDDLPVAAPDPTGVSRFNGTLGLDVRYPMIRRFEGGSFIVEPMAQLALSPDADINPLIPNEDSQVIELDQSTLFSDNKFPGYDLYEGGARASLGMRFAAEWNTSRSASLFIGRMFRAEAEDGYLRPVAGAPGTTYDPTGISETASDWVVAAAFNPAPGVAGWSRALLDDNLEIRRAEVGIGARLREDDVLALRYIIDNTDPSLIGSSNYETLQVSGQVFVVGDWGITFNAIRDLDDELWRRSHVGLLYQDECLRFELIYRRDESFLAGRGVSSSDGVFIRLNLATLGGSR